MKPKSSADELIAALQSAPAVTEVQSNSASRQSRSAGSVGVVPRPRRREAAPRAAEPAAEQPGAEEGVDFIVATDLIRQRRLSLEAATTAQIKDGGKEWPLRVTGTLGARFLARLFAAALLGEVGVKELEGYITVVTLPAGGPGNDLQPDLLTEGMEERWSVIIVERPYDIYTPKEFWILGSRLGRKGSELELQGKVEAVEPGFYDLYSCHKEADKTWGCLNVRLPTASALALRSTHAERVREATRDTGCLVGVVGDIVSCWGDREARGKAGAWAQDIVMERALANDVLDCVPAPGQLGPRNEVLLGGKRGLSADDPVPKSKIVTGDAAPFVSLRQKELAAGLERGAAKASFLGKRSAQEGLPKNFDLPRPLITAEEIRIPNRGIPNKLPALVREEQPKGVDSALKRARTQAPMALAELPLQPEFSPQPKIEAKAEAVKLLPEDDATWSKYTGVLPKTKGNSEDFQDALCELRRQLTVWRTRQNLADPRKLIAMVKLCVERSIPRIGMVSFFKVIREFFCGCTNFDCFESFRRKLLALVEHILLERQQREDFQELQQNATHYFLTQVCDVISRLEDDEKSMYAEIVAGWSNARVFDGEAIGRIRLEWDIQDLPAFTAEDD